MSLGTKIRILREKKGITRTCCDEFLNLMHRTVSNWENGYKVPEEEELLPDIANLFGIGLKDLLSAEAMAFQ